MLSITPLRIALIISGVVFVAELGVMITLRMLLPHLEPWVEVLLDSTTLVALLLPALIRFVVVPLQYQIQLRKEAENELRETNTRLEKRVVERTAELERRNQYAVLLNELGDLLQACNTSDEICRVIERISEELYPGSSGDVYKYSPAQNALELLYQWGEEAGSQSVFVHDACWALKTGRILMEIGSDVSPLCLTCKNKSDQGLCIPMAAHGETIGILRLKIDKAAAVVDRGKFKELDQKTMIAMSEHIALTLSNLTLREKLWQQATRDALTGLFNRRYLEETLEREVNRIQGTNAPLSILMLDIDHFKRFNDAFGHEAGDALLRKFGSFLMSQIRLDDVACRYGGEEFIVILPETNLETAVKRAEQLRVELCHLEVRHQGNSLEKATISVGIAVCPLHSKEGTALIQIADQALYKAKREGRNKVVVGNANPE